MAGDAEEEESKSKATEPAQKRSSKRQRYTAVVYFHGIGNQRRYEETSRLIDRLDAHQFNEHKSGNPKGLIKNIKARVEPLRGDENSRTIGYIRTYFSSGDHNTPSKTVRFYEVYWAPIMADVTSVKGVVLWAFSQVSRPAKTARSPWRERQRLRRSSLHALFKPGAKEIPGVLYGDCNKMLEHYNLFEGLDAHRRFPEGTFSQFQSYIAEENIDKPGRNARLQKLALIWRSAYRREEARNFIALLSIALALILSTAGILQFAMWLSGEILSNETYAAYLADVTRDWPTIATGVISIAGFFGLGSLLTTYLGDVEAWSTYHETDTKHVARQRVLDRAMETLSHALSDENCERVVIIGHSLGTSIANDALLALARRNKAEDIYRPMYSLVPLNKIDQFVTLGSPIDKIEYFFESFTSESHRYKRVKDDLRGDINTQPFSNRGIPQIHWVNFWDDGDPVSGPLQSPEGANRWLHKVDDVHVSTYSFPAPGASHAGYFENRTVISALYDMIFLGKHSYWPLRTRRDGTLSEFRDKDLGPGTGQGRRRAFMLLVLALPWLALAGTLSWLLGYTAAMIGIGMAGGLALLVIALGYAVSSSLGSRDPI